MATQISWPSELPDTKNGQKKAKPIV